MKDAEINRILMELSPLALTIFYGYMSNIYITKEELNIKNVKIEKRENFKYVSNNDIENIKCSNIINIYINKLKDMGLYNNIQILLYNLQNRDTSLINYYELFDLSMEIYQNNILYNGFILEKDQYLKSIGYGLNEGYRNILCERFFNLKSSSEVCQIEKYFAKRLEELIGTEKLQSIHFNSNLYELVDEFKHYDSYESIVKFIKNLDFISTNINNNLSIKKKTILKLLSENNLLLLKWYYIKQRGLYNDSLIDYFEYNNRINNYLNSMYSKVVIKNKVYNILDYKKIEKYGINMEKEKTLILKPIDRKKYK